MFRHFFSSIKTDDCSNKALEASRRTFKEDYNLEYGENSLYVQKKALQKYNSYAIVDDLLATGGTVNCVSKLLETNQKEVAGLLIVVELGKLGGRSKFNFPVESSLRF